MSENYSQEEHHKTYEDFYYEHLKQITSLKKQIEILEKSNEFFTTKMYGQLARDTKQQLKELREGSEE